MVVQHNLTAMNSNRMLGLTTKTQAKSTEKLSSGYKDVYKRQIPGSLAFYLWEPVGISYPELLDRMIQLALKRVREEESITFSFDTNILNQNSLGGVKDVYKRQGQILLGDMQGGSNL